VNTEPSTAVSDLTELLLGQLRHLRGAVRDKLTGMTAEQLQARILPSGWAPLELLNHLVHMERRWLVWGFLGEAVDDPWGDADAADRWVLPAGDEPAELVFQTLAGRLAEAELRTERIATQASLEARAALGGRFADDDPHPPTLGWILLHVIQEYARHAGQLDVVRELLDGAIGE
jgi:uncharacterized damage-inducible protein DinB